MEQKFKKDSWQWNFFQEYWKFVQAYYIPEDTDEWWGEVIKNSNALYKKYRYDLCRKLLIAFWKYLENRFK